MLTALLAASTNAANLILAQPSSAPSVTPSGGSGGGGFQMIIFLVIIMGIFYFVMFRDQRKKKSRRTQMLENIKKGDKVLTIGGMIGIIVGIKDTEVTIKVDEAANTKITFVRTAVDRVLTEREGT